MPFAPVLKADQVTATHDGVPLFGQVSFTLGPGERVGVVGPNGVGKSTLLDVLAGVRRPDGGHLRAPADVGYLRQEVGDPRTRVGDYLAGGLAEVVAAERDMHAMADRLTRDPSALADYDVAQERWAALEGWTSAARIAEVRDRLGIVEVASDTRLGEVSGGQQARIMLARLLLERPSVLLLDEPTNHLDADGITWLGDYLAGYPGGVIAVSHDRAFLDRVVHQVLELDGINLEPQWYTGGYGDYRVERQRRWERLLLDYEAQEKARQRLAEDIERTKGQARGVELTTHNDRLRRYAKKVAAKAKARERRLDRQMRSTAWIARPRERPRLVLDLAADADPLVTVARVRGARLDLGARTVLGDVDLTVRGGDRVVVGGTNGGGKTTLLRALHGDLAPVSGVIDVRSTVGYLPQVHDDLPMHRSPLAYLRGRLAIYEEDAEQLLVAYLFDEHAIHRPLARLSPGELRRLLFACLVNSGAELLLLDEPTNHLDFDSLDVVEEALRAYRGTIVAVTHDGYFADRLLPTHRWQVAGGRVTSAA